MQERHKCLCQGQEGEVVGDQLLVDQVDVDGLGLREVEAPLHARVEEDAVKVWVRGCDVAGEVRDAVEVSDVEGRG